MFCSSQRLQRLPQAKTNKTWTSSKENLDVKKKRFVPFIKLWIQQNFPNFPKQHHKDAHKKTTPQGKPTPLKAENVSSPYDESRLRHSRQGQRRLLTFQLHLRSTHPDPRMDNSGKERCVLCISFYMHIHRSPRNVSCHPGDKQSHSTKSYFPFGLLALPKSRLQKESHHPTRVRTFS